MILERSPRPIAATPPARVKWTRWRAFLHLERFVEAGVSVLQKCPEFLGTAYGKRRTDLAARRVAGRTETAQFRVNDL